jgi:hypothetical protein
VRSVDHPNVRAVWSWQIEDDHVCPAVQVKNRTVARVLEQGAGIAQDCSKDSVLDEFSPLPIYSEIA